MLLLATAGNARFSSNIHIHGLMDTRKSALVRGDVCICRFWPCGLFSHARFMPYLGCDFCIILNVFDETYDVIGETMMIAP